MAPCERTWWVGLSCVWLLSTVACGDGNTGNGVVESPDLGAKIDGDIVAADGGEIVFEKAGLTLRFPAGALDEDTTISIEVVSKQGLPDAALLAGNVFAIEPADLIVGQGVDVEIVLPEGSVPAAAKNVRLVWRNDEADRWADTESSDYEDGVVSGEVLSLAFLSVAFELPEPQPPPIGGPGNAAQCSATFDACGGNPEGAWTIVSGCSTTTPSNDYGVEDCAGASTSGRVGVSGELNLTGGRITGTIRIDTSAVEVIPKSCLGGDECRDLSGDGVMSIDHGTSCEFRYTFGDSVAFDASYSVTGSRIVISDFDPESGTPTTSTGQFCVTGSTLKVRSDGDADSGGFEYTAQRK